MKCIVGLGNPGEKYQSHRHNVGFMVLDWLSVRWNVAVKSQKFSVVYGKGRVQNVSVILVKPLLYMNKSGEALLGFLRFFRIDLSELLVLCDDLNLDFARVRIRQQGSHGGHNGLRSLIEALQSNAFLRVRVGIGRPVEKNVSEYVLSDFTDAEKEALPQLMQKLGDVVEDLCVETPQKVMNRYHGAL